MLWYFQGLMRSFGFTPNNYFCSYTYQLRFDPRCKRWNISSNSAQTCGLSAAQLHRGRHSRRSSTPTTETQIRNSFCCVVKIPEHSEDRYQRGHSQFELLPSGRESRSVKTKTNRLKAVYSLRLQQLSTHRDTYVWFLLTCLLCLCCKVTHLNI